jgi:hypothetical protein
MLETKMSSRLSHGGYSRHWAHEYKKSHGRGPRKTFRPSPNSLTRLPRRTPSIFTLIDDLVPACTYLSHSATANSFS